MRLSGELGGFESGGRVVADIARRRKPSPPVAKPGQEVEEGCEGRGLKKSGWVWIERK